MPALGNLPSVLIVILSAVLPALGQHKLGDPLSPTTPWDKIRAVRMSGDLKAFWDVNGGDNAYNYEQARSHGFELVDGLNTYSDYPGKQKENISKFLETNRTNPWKKPEFFERIIKRNITEKKAGNAFFYNDIEFPFEEDSDKAWADDQARAASRATDKKAFTAAYLREWATWFSLPCLWAKQCYPREPVGIYGPQPFRRDYFGMVGKSAKQIDGTHAKDDELWKYMDRYVDFYIASVYVFYDDPGSIYYIASNIEENFQRTRKYGNKPVYAYEWLLYHDSNKKLAGQELAPYLVEAMAVLPYFCGARGLALWGSEPKRKGQYYESLPLFVNSLGRVSDLSAKIAKAQLVADKPAHLLWDEKRPLIRKLKVSEFEWIILGCNPWQNDGERKQVNVMCGMQSVQVTIEGRHTDIFHLQNGKLTRMPMVR